MPLPSTLPVPRLKPGIGITRYQDSAVSPSPRFLLALEDSYFLVSGKTRALVVALLYQPADSAQLANYFEAESGHRVPAEQLIELAQSLPPALFAGAPAATRELPFLFSLTLLPARAATRVTGFLTWLFAPRLAIALMLAFAVLHIAVLPAAMRTAHGAWTAGQSAEMLALFMLSGLIHELGHTSACRYFKCRHGAIGVGLYFIFPAWYADVTAAWMLPAKQRAVVDLGGVYFQSIFLIAVDAFALLTGDPMALKLVWLITFTMLFTLNPVFKFDGYWLLSDLSGLHNLHKQVRQSTASMIAMLMRKRALAGPSVRSSVLYAYSVLSIGYFVYFGLFLARELGLLATTLLPKLSAAAQALRPVSIDHVWQLVVAAGAFCALLFWPIMILLGSFFFLDKLRRALSEIVASVQTARATVACVTPSLEKI